MRTCASACNVYSLVSVLTDEKCCRRSGFAKSAHPYCFSGAPNKSYCLLPAVAILYSTILTQVSSGVIEKFFGK